MHGIHRHEVDLRALLRPPVTEGSLIVLATAQNRENIFELGADLFAVQSEIGFVGENETAKGAARDLLAAPVRKFLQINIEPLGEAERQGGDGGNELAELRI